MKTNKILPIYKYIQTCIEETITSLSLHERINLKSEVHFQPGSRKHCTKNEMGEIATDWRRSENPRNRIDVSKLGADGFAMIFDNF